MKNTERDLKKTQRGLDRDRAKLEREEKKLVGYHGNLENEKMYLYVVVSV